MRRRKWGARCVPALAARVVRRRAMRAPDVCLPHPTGGALCLFRRTTTHVAAEHEHRVKGLLLLLHGWLQSGFPRVTQRVHTRKHHPPAPLPHRVRTYVTVLPSDPAPNQRTRENESEARPGVHAGR
jgi:hypothetical protein